MATPEHQGSFQTHANYLRAFATICGYTYGATRSKVLTQFAASIGRAIRGEGRAKIVSLDDVRRSLVNAWGTELILALSGRYATEDELMRLVNNWGAVQAYYIMYHATQAFCIARGMARPDSHPKTQRSFIDCWASRGPELPPLSLNVGAGGLFDGRNRLADIANHPWIGCTPTTALPLAGLALRTTRDDAVLDALRGQRESKRRIRRREWQEDETQRIADGRPPRNVPPFPLPTLNPAERADVVRNVRSYSMMDYLYRLRIKTNYEDARMFTEGPTDSSRSKQVHTDLMRITECALLATELRIRARVGTEVFSTWVRDWIESKTPKGLQLGVTARSELLLAP